MPRRLRGFAERRCARGRNSSAWLLSTNPAETVRGALIPIAGLFQVFDGTQVVSAGILRGIGDTRFPMMAAALGFWLVGLPLSVLLGFGAKLGAEGLWWGSLFALIAVAALLLYRVRMRLRRSMRRVIIDHAKPLADSQ